MEFYTIGVYNSEEEAFFSKLTENGIDTFADIRQRRGVRGGRYSFVNSRRLQDQLQELGIRYEHLPGLAPTTEIRLLQKNSDKQEKITSKERTRLSGVFAEVYTKEILLSFDVEGYIQQQEERGAEKIVLFCVEELPEACHRSIVADKIKLLGYNVTHI